MEKKISSDDLSLRAHVVKTMLEFEDEEAYGGFEGKIEKGKLSHFKYWVSRK